MFRLSTFSMVGNVFEAEPNTNWRLKSCKGLERTYKTAKRTETDVQSVGRLATILTSLFARTNDWELAFQIWKLSSLVQSQAIGRVGSNPQKNRFVFFLPFPTYFISFARSVFFVFVLFFSTVQCLLFFDLSYNQNIKIRVIKRQGIKLGYKQSGKPTTGTVRLGFRFRWGDPDNPSLNLQSYISSWCDLMELGC